MQLPYQCDERWELHESAYIFIYEMDMLIILYIWSNLIVRLIRWIIHFGRNGGLIVGGAGRVNVPPLTAAFFFFFFFLKKKISPSLSSEGFPEHNFLRKKEPSCDLKGCIGKIRYFDLMLTCLKYNYQTPTFIIYLYKYIFYFLIRLKQERQPHPKKK